MAKSKKKYSVRIQQEAIDELDQIYRYIFKESSGRAKIFVKNLKNKALSLADFPRRGSRARLLESRESLGEIRFLEYKGYLFFYTFDERTVTILHFAGPGQNWLDLFLG